MKKKKLPCSTDPVRRINSVGTWTNADNPRMLEALEEQRRAAAPALNLQQPDTVQPVQQSEVQQMPQEAKYR